MVVDTEVVIIGGGIIGLAIARELSVHSPSLQIVLLEKEKQLSTGISSRNSEVIHAGLYYPKHYLKSILCVRGREQLYQYCREKNIPHKKIGKIVVAHNDEEHEFLHALALRAEFNGVQDLLWLTRSKMTALEPALAAKGAFLSPSTGIIDVASLTRSFESDIRANGVDIALNTEVIRIEPQSSGFSVHCATNEPTQTTDIIHTRFVINAAGLQARYLASKINGFPAQQLPSMVLAKGDYFSYSGKNPFNHLIYPVPSGQPLSSPNAQHTGLGIHATLDMQNRLRFGPDFQLVETENYQVDENKRERFAETIAHYFPAVDKDKLQPAYAGIRPRLLPAADLRTADFLVQTSTQHSMNGLINLFGIESPGLTCCLALAQHVAELLGLSKSIRTF